MESVINLTNEKALELMNRLDCDDLKSAILTAIQFTLDNY